MFSRPIFWVLFTVAAVVCLIFTVLYFPRAFPIVSLELRMDRDLALRSAIQWANRLQIGPAEASRSASFGVNSAVQTYVELEAGGVGAFREMIRGDLFAPYTWEVRLFQEGETREATIWFTPEGDLFGFSETLSETEPGASLPTDQAQRIAESGAAALDINLAGFVLVEDSEEVRPGGRTDHSFVYERPDERVGEGRYRLRLTVSGDRLTETRFFIKIPESFSRRYQQMRSHNSMISFAATVLVGLIYIVGGCGAGLFYLVRRRSAIGRQALIWGAFIGLLQFLASVNQLPLAWMDYDTALSMQGFLARQFLQALGGAVAMGGLMTVTFMAAEGLTREAFPNQVQLWKLWSPGVANSSTILGRTIASYILVAVFFAYEVGLYLFSNKALGWWTPSDALIHPDALATFLPWLTSIAISAQAGFWEECLFRAVPVAGAALLGRRFGRPQLWIVGAVLVQAIVFGAAHANYPAQPAYARLVELLIPSFGFAGIYLIFGLLPAIVLHFAFDVVWFALPIFVSSASGVWLDQTLVVFLTLVPLWVVLAQRLREKRWVQPPEQAINRAWKKVASPAFETDSSDQRHLVPAVASAKVRRAVVSLGILGMAVWLLSSGFENHAPPLQIGRSQAESVARRALSEKGYEMTGSWSQVSSVEVPLNDNDRFVWQIGGRTTYERLMGTYLGPPFWSVRFVQFEGDVVERAEEYEVHLDGTAKVLRLRHTLPESREGPSLTKEESEVIAIRSMKELFGLNLDQLRTVSSEPSELPRRRDWRYTFADITTSSLLQQGEARALIEISGSEVTDAFRYVFVPEDWQRSERRSRNLLEMLSSGCSMVLAIVLLGGAVFSLIQWSRREFSVRAFFLLLVFVAAVFALHVVNSWPSVEARFGTAQPYSHQYLVALLSLLIMGLFVSLMISVIWGLAFHRIQRRGESTRGLVQGVFVGTLWAGILSLTASFGSSWSPSWADFSPASSSLPALEIVLTSARSFVVQTVFLSLLVVLLLGYLPRGDNWGRFWPDALLVPIGFALAGSNTLFSLTSWLGAGVLMSGALIFAYRTVFRHTITAAGTAIATLLVLDRIGDLFVTAFPGQVAGSILAIASLTVLLTVWLRWLSVQEPLHQR